MKKNVFPFTAIVGQEKIKKSLILNAINTSIGGVLIKGNRGTGKTTAVRALANLLPEIEVVEGCAFNCDEDSYREFELYKADDYNIDNKSSKDDVCIVKKSMQVIELPLGATEDRVIGSLDIEKALKVGIKALEPGLLALANNNILYIDEINLLDDNLVDILLDAAAFGVNTIEREGISISHPSHFILVGTMNPEEGELRGQLSDRIGLEVESESIVDIEDKILIMKRREEFEKDPTSFIAKFYDDEKELQKKIVEGRKLLPTVRISDEYIEIIARITRNLNSEGHRKDIAILKTSKTIAAFTGHWKVLLEDLEEAILLVLGEINQCNNSQAQNQIQQAQNEMKQDQKQGSDENNNDNSKENEDIKDDLTENNQNQLNNDSSDENDLNFDDESSYDDGNNYNNENHFDDNYANNNHDNRYNDNEITNSNGNDEYNENNLDNDSKNNENNENNEDNNDNEYGNNNQLQGEVNDSNQINDEYQVDYNENRSQKEIDNFDMESLEKDITKMLVMEGREKEKFYGSRVDSKSEKGKYVKSKYSQNVSSSDIAVDATLRAAAMRFKKKEISFDSNNKNNKNDFINKNGLNNSNNLNKNNDLNNPNGLNSSNDLNKNNDLNNPNGLNNSNCLKINVKSQDIRAKVRKHKARASVAIVVDMSGSMLSEKKVNKIRGILDKIIKNINQNRDKLSVIGFKGQGSEIIIPNTKRPSSFLEKLDKITVGGTTPMAAGLKQALEILNDEKKNGEFIPMLILLSDGMPNIALNDNSLKIATKNPVNNVLAIGKELADIGIYTIIIDFEKKHKHGRNINMELAFLSNGRYYDLEDVYNPDIAIDKILTYERSIL